MIKLVRDGVELTGYDLDGKLPVIFQHGLGGDASQVAEVFPDDPAFRRLTLECRAQGASETGAYKQLSIAAFADDVIAYANARGVDTFIVGGISMGAAIALRLAVTAPDRVRGLIIARPAWLWEPAPANMTPFHEVGLALRHADREKSRRDFEQSATGAMLATNAPDNLASLLNFFGTTKPESLAELLSRISLDGPGVTLEQIRAIAVPSLVIAHGLDLVHPLAYGRTLASEIKGSTFVEIAPKVGSKAQYVREFKSAVSDFLTRNKF
jgi:pimeloyl-ACP methyl ester carboxylesterase